MKKYCGRTPKKLREYLQWLIEGKKHTTPAKCLECYDKKRSMMLNGEWDTCPQDIKDNLSFYALIHVKNNPGIIEAEKLAITRAISELKWQQAELSVQIERMEKYIGGFR